MKNIELYIILCATFLSGCEASEEAYMKLHSSGVTDAASLSQADCLESSIKKIKSCASVECSVNINGYFLGCFTNALKSPKVCVDVPVWEGVQNHGKWRSDQCAAKSADPVHCDILFASLQRECH